MDVSVSHSGFYVWYTYCIVFQVSGNKGKSYMYTHLEAYYEQREQVLEDVNVALDDEVLVGPRHKVSTSGKSL